MSDGVLGALVGVAGTIIGTLLGYLLSRRASSEQWRRDLEDRQQSRVLQLVEETLGLCTELALATDQQREGQEEQTVKLITRMRILEAQSARVDPHLARLMDDARNNLFRDDATDDRYDRVAKVGQIATIWLSDPHRLHGLTLEDLPPIPGKAEA